MAAHFEFRVNMVDVRSGGCQRNEQGVADGFRIASPHQELEDFGFLRREAALLDDTLTAFVKILFEAVRLLGCRFAAAWFRRIRFEVGSCAQFGTVTRSGHVEGGVDEEGGNRSHHEQFGGAEVEVEVQGEENHIADKRPRDIGKRNERRVGDGIEPELVVEDYSQHDLARLGVDQDRKHDAAANDATLLAQKRADDQEEDGQGQKPAEQKAKIVIPLMPQKRDEDCGQAASDEAYRQYRVSVRTEAQNRGNRAAEHDALHGIAERILRDVRRKLLRIGHELQLVVVYGSQEKRNEPGGEERERDDACRKGEAEGAEQHERRKQQRRKQERKTDLQLGLLRVKQVSIQLPERAQPADAEPETHPTERADEERSL